MTWLRGVPFRQVQVTAHLWGVEQGLSLCRKLEEGPWVTVKYQPLRLKNETSCSSSSRYLSESDSVDLHVNSPNFIAFQGSLVQNKLGPLTYIGVYYVYCRVVTCPGSTTVLAQWPLEQLQCHPHDSALDNQSRKWMCVGGFSFLYSYIWMVFV